MSDKVYLDEIPGSGPVFMGLVVKTGTRIGTYLKSPVFGADLWQKAWVIGICVQNGSKIIQSRETDDGMERLLYVDEIGLPLVQDPRPSKEALLEILGRLKAVMISSQYSEEAILRFRFRGHVELRFRCTPGPVLGPVPHDFFVFPDEEKKRFGPGPILTEGGAVLY